MVVGVTVLSPLATIFSRVKADVNSFVEILAYSTWLTHSRPSRIPKMG
jgi:hypothetical protein